MKEIGLLTAFVVLGGLLLLCLWVSENFDRSLLSEFKSSQVTIILKDRQDDELKTFLDQNSQVVSYKIYKAKDNKDRLTKIYPELGNVVSQLEEKFFPISALVKVRDVDAFMTSLKPKANFLDTQIVHKPPYELQRFIKILTFVFTALWLITLALVLYFHLERLAVKEMPRWSLLKMLGERPYRLFMPLWIGQFSRVLISSILALTLALLAISQIKSFVAWNWSVYPYLSWGLFFLVSILITSVLSYSLFYAQFRRVSVG
jgi:hypothetical protein